MTKLKYLASLFTLFILTGNLLGQDLHFSQFYSTPLYTNPANAGLISGDCRGTLDYRSQWGSISTPFVTTTGSYEKKKYIGSNYLGYGILFLNDKSGTQTLSQNEISFSGTYQKNYGHQKILSLGVQAGFVHKGIKSNLTFDANYDEAQGGFNPNLGSGEGDNQLPPPIYYPDISAGLMYQTRKEIFSYDIGFALFHILRPDDSFYDNQNNFGINHKYTVNGGFKLKLMDMIYMKPKFLVMSQGVSKEAVLGGEISYESESAGFHAGVFMRKTSNTSDAIIPVAGIIYGPFDFSLSYDLNISLLANATGTVGGYELSLVYNCASSKIYKVAVPCRRY